MQALPGICPFLLVRRGSHAVLCGKPRRRALPEDRALSIAARMGEYVAKRFRYCRLDQVLDALGRGINSLISLARMYQRCIEGCAPLTLRLVLRVQAKPLSIALITLMMTGL
jgi:hypothetical protein